MQDLTQILNEYKTDPMQPSRRRQRIAKVAGWACENYPGDIVEIGAHVGKTTIKLLEVAKKFGRRVLVIDPWAKGTQNCRGGELARFRERTELHKDRLDVIRARSDDQCAIEVLHVRKIAFALVDGLHTLDACYNDISNVSRSGIICVDDILRMDDVRIAFISAAHDLGREAIRMQEFSMREGYLL